MVSLARAVFVWAVLLVTIILPRLHPQVADPANPVVTQLSAYHQASVLDTVREQRTQAAQAAEVDNWTREYNTSWIKYQAQLQAQAAAQAEAARIAALSNHPPPPAYIATIIHDAFIAQGEGAVTWAFNVAYCESRYHPNSVNSSSGASGLFQFLPSTWAFTPEHAQSPFDPTANANAAAWLYQRDGPSQWQCQG